jgi:hypothetical protein
LRNFAAPISTEENSPYLTGKDDVPATLMYYKAMSRVLKRRDASQRRFWDAEPDIHMVDR